MRGSPQCFLFWNCQANRNCLSLWGIPLNPSSPSGLLSLDHGWGLLRPWGASSMTSPVRRLLYVRLLLCSWAIRVSHLPLTSLLCGFTNPTQEFFWNRSVKTLSLGSLIPQGYLWLVHLSEGERFCLTSLEVQVFPDNRWCDHRHCDLLKGIDGM